MVVFKRYRFEFIIFTSMRLRSVSIVFIIITISCIFCTMSCRKQTRLLTTGGILTFSDDTLKFDTVFTAAGSFTTGLLIYNPQNEPISISSVKLKNGAASYFHINVDGFVGNSVTNINIAAHDSVYVFATVNINPTDTTTPFIVSDELIATLNGRDFVVPFTAYGQNAHYITGDSLYGNTTWLTDKPYVVQHSCVIGPGATLTIPAKCRVYMHQDARFFVFGTLNVNPNPIDAADSVVFQGDRLDRDYFGRKGYPGEWGGFYFVTGSSGAFKKAVIKNCGGGSFYRDFYAQPAAMQVDSGAYVTINNTIIKNSIGYGILNWQGNVTATNCFIGTTGAEALVGLQGGFDSMTNCTFANYGDASVSLEHRPNHTVVLLNYFQVSNTLIYYGSLDAVLRNCIVYGSLDSEIICDRVTTYPASVRLDHCLLKIGSIIDPSFMHLTACLQNQDPLFKKIEENDFHIKASSPAIGNGVNIPSVDKDLEGNSRSGINDIGCYKYTP